MSLTDGHDLQLAMASLGWLTPDPQPIRCTTCHDVIPGDDCGFGDSADLCLMCDYRATKAACAAAQVQHEKWLAENEVAVLNLAAATRRERDATETFEAMLRAMGGTQ